MLGFADGAMVGDSVGPEEGSPVGAEEGDIDGCIESVGAGVGCEDTVGWELIDGAGVGVGARVGYLIRGSSEEPSVSSEESSVS